MVYYIKNLCYTGKKTWEYMYMPDNKTRTEKMLLCAMFTALITIGSFIRIPLPLIPITLQYFMTVLAGMLLGGKLGALSVLAYLGLGLAGLPVFSGGGGLGYIVKPTFGYLLSFAAGTFVTGYLSASAGTNIRRLLTAALAGMLIVYSGGTAYCWLIYRFYLQQAIGFWPLLLSCVIMPLPKDILLCWLAAFLAKKLKPLIGWSVS